MRLADRYGYRGLWLMLLGATWFAFGVGVLFDPAPDRPFVLYEVLPAQVQAAGWWITGGLAVRQGLRGPNHDDIAGHVALYVMPAIRLLSFALSWLVYLGTETAQSLGWVDQPTGYAEGWYAALIWVLVSLMLLLGASWPNPNPPLPHPPTTTGVDQ